MKQVLVLVAVFVISASTAKAESDDVSITNNAFGDGSLTTINIHITEEIATQIDLLIDYDYGEFRTKVRRIQTMIYGGISEVF